MERDESSDSRRGGECVGWCGEGVGEAEGHGGRRRSCVELPGPSGGGRAGVREDGRGGVVPAQALDAPVPTVPLVQ